MRAAKETLKCLGDGGHLAKQQRAAEERVARAEDAERAKTEGFEVAAEMARQVPHPNVEFKC